jgi:hypothetical protein
LPLSHIAGRRDGYRPESDVAVPPSNLFAEICFGET